MGFSHNRSRKETQRRLDREDPERRQVRSLIRRGKAPRLTMAQNANGHIPQRGTFRFKPKAWRHTSPAQRAYVIRMNNMIRYTIGAIFSNKTAKGLHRP